jgi:hypothetical protein
MGSVMTPINTFYGFTLCSLSGIKIELFINYAQIYWVIFYFVLILFIRVLIYLLFTFTS